jgi:catechol 2,3-dioxygenase-like lactoylglutathione lyase family enzyme
VETLSFKSRDFSLVGDDKMVAAQMVEDARAALRFYGETLGLTQLWENPAAVRYRCGEVSELSVFKRPGLDTVHTLAHFEVAAPLGSGSTSMVAGSAARRAGCWAAAPKSYATEEAVPQPPAVRRPLRFPQSDYY